MGKTCSECVSWDELPEYITNGADLGVCHMFLDDQLGSVIRTGKGSYFDIEAVVVRGSECPDEFECPYFARCGL